MHLIPHSWAHLHMLVSVFPSVGLVFVLGMYITSLRTDNKLLKRSSLAGLAVLALLVIPTYVSGSGSMASVLANPQTLAGMTRPYAPSLDAHYAWSWAAMAALVITGALAGYELYRFRHIGYLSEQMLKLILALGILTLALMVVVGELGWEIMHAELRFNPASLKIDPGSTTPQTWAHVHMIVNHFPTVGFTVGLAFYLIALYADNEGMKRASLVIFTVCSILGIPTYVTGAAAMWMLTEIPGISQAAINAHRDFALWSLFGMGFTGVTAWIQLWRYRHLGSFSNRALYLVLAFAVITFGFMAETGHRGGQINHPEIRVDALPTDANAYLSPHIENLINNVQYFVPWQTVHFFGYSLVFGTVLAVTLRIFGFWKSVPFSAIHRILPLGVFGVTMNIFTGMLMLMADTFRYVNEATFIPKMFFLPIGAIAVLYFSLSESLWKVKAGEEAPISAKWVAGLVLLSWMTVIMGGRLLPYV
jgi:uncharacterized membrane protein